MSQYAFSPAVTPEELAGFELNDLGNAMRLIRLTGGALSDDGEVLTAESTLLFLRGVGWIGFNGRHWDLDYGEDLARRSAHRVARQMRTPGIAALVVETGRVTPKEFWRWADGVGSAGSTTAMLRQAQSYLAAEIGDFDRDRLALNCRNGTLKLLWVGGDFGAVLEPHRAGDRITRMTAVDYDPDAAAPLFEKVVLDSLPDDGERGAYRRALGYATTGFTHEQAFFLTQGRGQDGKSTILDAAREALGSYAAVGDRELFLEGPRTGGGGPNPEMMKLAGDVRFVVLSEPPRGSKLNEGLLKAWTSGAPVSARDLHAKPVSFRPIGKLIWECNAFPVARGDDDGIWRRIKTALFRRQVPKAKLDRTIPDRIRDGELPGVLNWLIAGVGDWLRTGGLGWPDSFERALEDYRKASSPFGDWLAERCVTGEAAVDDIGAPCRTLSSELHASFKEWAEAQGIEKPMGVTAFGRALTDRQVIYAGKDRRGNKLRSPIRLKSEAERAAENEAAADADEAALAPPPPLPGPSGAGGWSLPPDDEDDGQ